MEKMTVPFDIKNIDSDPKYFTFEGYASTFGNVDEGGDRVMKGAFSEMLREIEGTGVKIPILWQHDTGEPVGVFDQVSEDEKGLFVVGKMPKKDTFVTGRVMPQMEVGSISKLSIGYGLRPGGSRIVDDIRELTDLQVFETSLVTFPMNNQATILAMKAADFDNLDLEDIRQLERELRGGVKFSSSMAKKLIAAMKSYGMLRDEQTERRDAEMLTELDTILKKIKEI